MHARGRAAVHQRLRYAVARLVEAEAAAALRRGRPVAAGVAPELLAPWIASTFVLVLEWWVATDRPVPARDADGLFRRLVEPALGPLAR